MEFLDIAGAISSLITSVTLSETVEDPIVKVVCTLGSAMIYGVFILLINVFVNKKWISKEQGKDITEDLTDDGKINGSNKKKGE